MAIARKGSDVGRPPQNPRDTERTLEAVANEWRATFDAVPQALVVLDLDGRILRMNRLALALASGAYQDHIGQPIEHLGPQLPWLDVARLHDELVSCRVETTVEATDPEGKRSWVLSGSLLTATDGVADGVIIGIHDQTERVRLEASLHASEKMAAMGNLVAGVSHEVRNPLFGISATLDTFHARFGDQPETAKYFDVLRRQVDRLTVLMEDLLEYAHPPRLEPRPHNLRDALDDAIRSCSPLAEEKDVSFVVEVDTTLPTVEMDPSRFASVLGNLIENAVHHSPAGGRVRIRTTQALNQGRSWACCIVSDRGPGVAAKDLDRIFEPFFSRRRGGTGLGLAIVHRIMQEHGGRIDVRNRDGGGLESTVYLPIDGTSFASVF